MIYISIYSDISLPIMCLSDMKGLMFNLILNLRTTSICFQLYSIFYKNSFAANSEPLTETITCASILETWNTLIFLYSCSIKLLACEILPTYDRRSLLKEAVNLANFLVVNWRSNAWTQWFTVIVPLALYTLDLFSKYRSRMFTKNKFYFQNSKKIH